MIALSHRKTNQFSVFYRYVYLHLHQGSTIDKIEIGNFNDGMQRKFNCQQRVTLRIDQCGCSSFPLVVTAALNK